MGSVNTINPAVDLTVRVYDEFYEFAVDVDANEYDVVNSFFESAFGTKDAAANFTATLFRIADQTQTPVLTLLAEIEDMDKIQLTATLAYYLNGIRSSSTLLGVNVPTQSNYYVAHNIRI